MKPKKYSGYFREHIKAIIFVVFLTIIAKTCTFYSTQILRDIVNEVSELEFVFSDMAKTATILFGIEILLALASFLSSRTSIRIRASITRAIHMDLGRAIANSTPKTVRANNCVELSEKMREGNNFVEGIYGIYNQAFAILLGIAALIYTFTCSILIGCMFVSFFLVILVIQVIIIKKMLKKRGEASSASDSSKKLLVEILEGFPDVKSLSMLGGLKTHFTHALNNEYNRNMASANISVLNELWTNLILSIYKLTFILVSAWLIYKGDITKGDFVALFMYRNYVYGLVNSVLLYVKGKTEVKNSVKRMNEIFEYKAVSEDVFGTTKFYPVRGDLEIKNLSANYDGKTVLKDVSLNIPAGKFVVISGSSGCGKSTLLNILARQESLSSGKITIDGVDMFDLDYSTYHRAIAHLPQFPFMFSMSIKDNLLLANPEATDEHLIWALKECYAMDFVEERGGLDAFVEPDQLSGGQQQRLALARLATRGGRIILLDESTSALDAISQEEIVKTIRRATSSGHTVILVSHRVAPLKKADTIVYMSDGVIADQGTYDELYERNAKFREMIDLG